MTTLLACSCGLVLLQGFFAGSELALMAADRDEVSARARRGSRGARAVGWFLASPHRRLLPTTLMGVTLCVILNTMLIALGGLRVLGLQETLAPWLLLGIALMMFVVGRVIPRVLGQGFADTLAPLAALPLGLAFVLFRPLSILFDTVVGSLSRAFGLDHARLMVTREELELLVRAPRAETEPPEKGEITEPERSMIANIFEFGDTTVYDVMVPLSEVAALPASSTMEEAVAAFHDKHHTRMPLYRERVDEVIGVVHGFDLLRAPKGATLAEVARPPHFVPESQPVLDLLVAMRREKERFAVVVDEYGGATGIVTDEDILEEIVGEIEDETDVEEISKIRQEEPGVWRVAARTDISEVNRALGIALPEGEDYESVAGLLLDRMRRIPRPKETLRLPGVTITIIGASDRAVEDVRIRVTRR
jgi:CBS domain containing-hemolysin-like protein